MWQRAAPLLSFFLSFNKNRIESNRILFSISPSLCCKPNRKIEGKKESRCPMGITTDCKMGYRGSRIRTLAVEMPFVRPNANNQKRVYRPPPSKTLTKITYDLFIPPRQRLVLRQVSIREPSLQLPSWIRRGCRASARWLSVRCHERP